MSREARFSLPGRIASPGQFVGIQNEAPGAGLCVGDLPATQLLYALAPLEQEIPPWRRALVTQLRVREDALGDAYLASTIHGAWRQALRGGVAQDACRTYMRARDGDPSFQRIFPDEHADPRDVRGYGVAYRAEYCDLDMRVSANGKGIVVRTEISMKGDQDLLRKALHAHQSVFAGYLLLGMERERRGR